MTIEKAPSYDLPENLGTYGGTGMLAALKKRWIKALLSGNYKQASGYLESERGFCCLGVLCKITRQTRGKLETVNGFASSFKIRKYKDKSQGKVGSTNFPTAYMMEQWGLDCDDAQELAKRNDRGDPFKEIAEWINKNVPTRMNVKRDKKRVSKVV